jgi:hypothetical protein
MKRALLLLVFLTVVAQPALAGTFRCNNEIFSERDTRLEVLLKVDWYYNCGERQFIVIITFKGGEIVRIRRSDSRGSGENIRDCY